MRKLCVYMGMNWSYDPSPEELRKQNDEVLQALQHWSDRCFGFVYLSPKHVELIKTAIENEIKRIGEDDSEKLVADQLRGLGYIE